MFVIRLSSVMDEYGAQSHYQSAFAAKTDFQSHVEIVGAQGTITIHV